MLYILLSTYNGEPFLAKQLDSLFAQDYKHFHLIIRDDGSTDGTVKILQDYQLQHSNMTLQLESNVGVVKSFFNLLTAVPDDAQYIALCDQDDNWHSDKLRAAVAALQSTTQPCLFHSAMTLIDANDQVIGEYHERIRKMNLPNALVENVVTGCTAVFNRALLDKLRPLPDDVTAIPMHDWWLYQVATALGAVIYDAKPHMEYRRHVGNTVGHESLVAKYWQKLRDVVLYRHQHRRAKLAGLLLKRYQADLSSEQCDQIEALIDSSKSSLLPRLRYAINTPCFMQMPINSFVLKLLMVFNCV
tara:strand:+ start:191630 stop:192535 length:906 start_codon:yes stop_codon:yes gene_type:complete